ncbi:MAG: Rieske (2Fe-2S) protein [Syntrophales bacterium]|jgi:Rieske Fe-S protein|nr:Rieske (2Fe-2S) protein [Syntrophales bacterium]
MAKTGQSRRRFLVALAFLATGLLSLTRFLKPAAKSKKTLLAVAEKDIPSNGALVYKEARVAIIRESGKISAVSLVCTHLGCTVSATTDELVCPCHGSSFDWKGIVIKGPADRPLPQYKVEERDGRIVVLL